MLLGLEFANHPHHHFRGIAREQEEPGDAMGAALDGQVRANKVCQRSARLQYHRSALLQYHLECRQMHGQTIHQYLVLEKLGQGGMGVVWKAKDTRLNRFVAIKTLPSAHLGNSESRRRFLQEARALSALNHPHIVTVYDLVEDGGQDHLIMEFVPGRTLGRVISRKGLGVEDTLRYAVQMADGLAAAHKAGIIHRDLKPGNVIVTDSGQVKLLDFGLAKVVPVVGEEDETLSLREKTETGAVMGTVNYMSPEQASGHQVDARTDIFSLGAVLYEMLSGRRAFQGDSPAATVSTILRDEPKPIADDAPGAAHDLVKAIHRCLRKDPGKRWQNMADLRVALAEIRAESESGGTQAAATATPKRWIWAATLIPLAGALAWLGFQTRPAGPAAGELRAVPLTSEPDMETNATFSPDGSQIAYTQAKQDRGQWRYQVMVRVAGEAAGVQLTKAGESWAPSWSPDGRLIAFNGVRDGGPPSVYTIPPVGGAERKVAQSVSVSTPFWTFGRTLVSYPASWSPDSRWLAVRHYDPQSQETSIVLAGIEKGEQRVLIGGVKEPGTLSSPAISPDGHHLSFVRTSRGFGELNDLLVVTLTADLQPSGDPLHLGEGLKVKDQCTWAADSTALLCVAGDSVRRVLTRIPANGSRSSTISAAGTEVSYPAVSRSNNKLAFTRAERAYSDIAALNLDPASSNGPPILFIASTRDEYGPRFSPDSGRIAFTSTRSGKFGIWVCGKDGSQPRMLDAQDVTTGSPTWSPDGKRIAYDSRVTGQGDIYLVSSDGGPPRRLTSSDAVETSPSWSRDGAWIYFGSDQTGRPEIWKLPSAGGATVQVTRNGGLVSSESPDGKTLYYLKDRNVPTPLWARPTAGGEEKKVAEAVWQRAFHLSTSGVYFVDTGPGEKLKINLYNPVIGTTRPLRELSGFIHLGLTVSLDEKTGLVSVYEQSMERSDLMLIENFR